MLMTSLHSQAHIEKYDAQENMQFMAEQGRHVESLASDDLFIAPLDLTAATRPALRFKLPSVGCTMDIQRSACHTLSLPTALE